MYTQTQLKLNKLVGKDDSAFYIRLAKAADKQEAKNKARAHRAVEQWINRIIDDIIFGATPNFDALDLEDIFVETMFDTMFGELEGHEKRMPAVRLKEDKKKKQPTLREKLIKQYRSYVKTKQSKVVSKKEIKKITQSYIDVVKDWYEKKQQKTLKEGEMWTPNELKEDLRKITKAEDAHLNTTIRTQTTAYQNKVREDFYTPIETVTHFIFMSIRDHRTTEWCKERHGLVYDKTSEYYKKELPPPIHWNCRSEILPLDTDNPNHTRLINDKTKQRKNHFPKPLPKQFVRS